MSQASLSKRDISMLGRKLSERLLQNTNTNPYELPELIQCECWQKANTYLRQEFVTQIVEAARSILLASNYSKDVVLSVIQKSLTAKGIERRT